MTVHCVQVPATLYELLLKVCIGCLQAPDLRLQGADEVMHALAAVALHSGRFRKLLRKLWLRNLFQPRDNYIDSVYKVCESDLPFFILS